MGLAACSRPCVITAELDSVADAIDHPDADYVMIAAVPLKDAFSRYEYTYTSFSAGSRISDPREEWVLPLVDPGVTLNSGDTVHAWAMTSAPQARGTDPGPWLMKVEQTFDGHPIRRRSHLRFFRLEQGPNHRYHAIREAERLHNLKSHPNAPIFGVK